MARRTTRRPLTTQELVDNHSDTYLYTDPKLGPIFVGDRAYYVREQVGRAQTGWIKVRTATTSPSTESVFLTGVRVRNDGSPAKGGMKSVWVSQVTRIEHPWSTTAALPHDLEGTPEWGKST